MDPTLRALASKQGNVVTTAQALAHGYEAKEIQRLVRHDIWRRVRRGAYVEGKLAREADLTTLHLLRCAAVALALDAPAVFSHHSAAAIHGIELLKPDLSNVHVTRSSGVSSRGEAGVRHHRAALLATDVVACERGLVTTVARTAADLAREGDHFAAVVAIDSALRAGASRDAIKEVLERCRDWPGSRQAWRAFHAADAGAANPGETFARLTLVDLGLPVPRTQVEIYDADGFVGRVDFLWDGVVGEFDGRAKYRVRQGQTADEAGETVFAEKLREDRLRSLGYEVVRFTWADLQRPERLGGRVRDALTRASIRGSVAA